MNTHLIKVVCIFLSFSLAHAKRFCNDTLFTDLCGNCISQGNSCVWCESSQTCIPSWEEQECPQVITQLDSCPDLNCFLKYTTTSNLGCYAKLGFWIFFACMVLTFLIGVCAWRLDTGIHIKRSERSSLLNNLEKDNNSEHQIQKFLCPRCGEIWRDESTEPVQHILIKMHPPCNTVLRIIQLMGVAYCAQWLWIFVWVIRPINMDSLWVATIATIPLLVGVQRVMKSNETLYLLVRTCSPSGDEELEDDPVRVAHQQLHNVTQETYKKKLMLHLEKEEKVLWSHETRYYLGKNLLWLWVLSLTFLFLIFIAMAGVSVAMMFITLILMVLYMAPIYAMGLSTEAVVLTDWRCLKASWTIFGNVSVTYFPYEALESVTMVFQENRTNFALHESSIELPEKGLIDWKLSQRYVPHATFFNWTFVDQWTNGGLGKVREILMGDLGFTKVEHVSVEKPQQIHLYVVLVGTGIALLATLANAITIWTNYGWTGGLPVFAFIPAVAVGGLEVHQFVKKRMNTTKIQFTKG